MGSRERREDVKIVLIDTRYVVADPLSFKSVVQNLTGKDSCVSWIEESAVLAGAKRKRETDNDNISNGGRLARSVDHQCSAGSVSRDGHGGSDFKLSKGLSFKDLDRMILEMTPMDEWYQLLAHSNLL